MRTSPLKHKLAKYRVARGLTQGEMATMLFVSKSTVQAIELLKLEMSPNLEARFSALTGESLRAILDRRVEEYRRRIYRKAGLNP